LEGSKYAERERQKKRKKKQMPEVQKSRQQSCKGKSHQRVKKDAADEEERYLKREKM